MAITITKIRASARGIIERIIPARAGEFLAPTDFDLLLATKPRMRPTIRQTGPINAPIPVALRQQQETKPTIPSTIEAIPRPLPGSAGAGAAG